MSNDHVSWLAPPDSFAAFAIPVAPGYQETTQRPSSACIICLYSLALELCRALFQEGGDALLEIRRGARSALRLEFQVELVLERIVGRVPIKFSDQRQRHRRPVGKLMRELHGFFHQR